MVKRLWKETCPICKKEVREEKIYDCGWAIPRIEMIRCPDCKIMIGATRRGEL